MIAHESEALKPKRRNLIQDRAFEGHRIRQDAVEGGNAIGRDEEERLAQIKYFADFAAAEFWDREIERDERRRHLKRTLNAER